MRRKEQIEDMKNLYGDEYYDFNLVFCHSTGRPIESSVIRNSLKKLIKEHDLPPVVFHSFRHASITYKLKWNGGDMKAVQGDSGHAQMDMIVDVYSHIIDEDRRYNAQKFKEQFYNTKGLRINEEKEVPTPNFEGAILNKKKAAYREKIEEEVVVEEPEIIEEPIKVEDSSDEETKKEESNIEFITKLLTNPETAALLKILVKNM